MHLFDDFTSFFVDDNTVDRILFFATLLIYFFSLIDLTTERTVTVHIYTSLF